MYFITRKEFKKLLKKIQFLDNFTKLKFFKIVTKVYSNNHLIIWYILIKYKYISGSQKNFKN